MRTTKVSLIPILFLVSIFSFYSENSFARMCCGADADDNTLEVVEGTRNIVNYLDHLRVEDSNRITISYRVTFTKVSGITYQIENAEECLGKIKGLVAPNTSYYSLEVKGPKGEVGDQNLQFILKWRYWDKTEQVICPVKFIEIVSGGSMNS